MSAAQSRVEIGEDGQPSFPSDVVLDSDKGYTHSLSPVVTPQVKDGPPAPPDNVFTASPLLKHEQVARPQSPSSSPTFERQVLASVPTTNSQPVAPISAASNPNPPISPGSPDARPISTTDISTTGSPTIGYSLNQPVTQSPNPERGQSSSTFERQVLASVPTTNSQPVAPISAASNPNPRTSPGSPDARPISTTDISTAGSPTIGYSLNQSVTQSPNLERGQPARQVPRRSGTSGTMRTFGTSAGNSIAQTEYTDMVFEDIPLWSNVMTCVLMWIVLAGFLVLPSSFPNIQTIVGDSNKLTKVVHDAQHIPLYVPFFPLVPLCKAKKGSTSFSFILS
jgi:hypothetical protein